MISRSRRDSVGVGGGVVAPFFRDPKKPTRFGGGGGGVVAAIFVSRGTHFGQLRQKSRFIAKK